jgi:hypothetical protein
VFADVDWSHRARYIEEKHNVTAMEANEALADPMRLVLDPDPKGRSGDSARIFGWSQTYGAVLTVIVVRHDGREYGANAWRTDGRELREYREYRVEREANDE